MEQIETKELIYLSDILWMDNIDVLKETEDKNILLTTPTGSGKSRFTFDVLFADNKKKYLLLVDNDIVKAQSMKEDNTCNSKRLAYIKGKYLKFFGRRNITVKCINEMVNDISSGKDSFDDYDLTVIDEFHNAFVYYTWCKNQKQKDKHLKFLFEMLKKSKSPKVFLTATPYYYNQFVKKQLNIIGIDFSTDIKHIDYLYDKRIKRHTSKYIYEFNSGDIVKIVKHHKKDLEEGKKIFINMTYINSMIALAEELNKLDYCNCISIWSINNKDKPMNNEQLNTRSKLIDDGDCNCNILITNASTETGLNIYDDAFDISICNSTNVTRQIQSRGRLRKNITFEYILSNMPIKNSIEVNENIILPNELLNDWLTKQQLETYVNSLDKKDSKNRPITVNAFLEDIGQQGYKVDKKPFRDKEYYYRTGKSKNITKYRIIKLY